MTCPKCSQPMEPVTVGVLVVDRCTSCGGLWFDMNEDEHLKRAGAASVVDTGEPPKGPREEQAVIECPRCHTRMMRMVDPGRPSVKYESCAICYGNFFDAGEFREISSSGVLDGFRRWFSGERP